MRDASDMAKKEGMICQLYRFCFVILLQVLLLGSLVSSSVVTPLLYAGTLEMFVDELPMMPKIKGYDEIDGGFFPSNLTIGMYMKEWKFHKHLPSSEVFAFGTSREEATVPGPTIEAISGVDTYLNWENRLPDHHMFTIDHTIGAPIPKLGIPTVVHLHGSVTEPQSDGNALAWFTAGFKEKGDHWQKKVYHYHNTGETVNLWYHDHAFGYTRLNLLAGLLGAYVVRNLSVESVLKLPSGIFDRNLVVFDRSFTRDGHIFINSTGVIPSIHPEWQPEYFGDVVIVNGKAWPYMHVSRRKYRFRVINASNARFYRFSLDNGQTMTQIGSDAFYLQKPVRMKSILLAPSEIMDVIIDFSESRTKEIILENNAPYPYPSGDPVNKFNSKVMKFVVTAGKTRDNSRMPLELVKVAKIQAPKAAIARNIILYEYDNKVTGDPTLILINFMRYTDPIMDKPIQGSTELWHIINLTNDNHPFHVHLIAFQVLTQYRIRNVDALTACTLAHNSTDPCNLWTYISQDLSEPPPPNERGWKNVFKARPSFVTTILIQFSLINSMSFPFNVSAEPSYTYHCHILDHEDNDMMRPYQILPSKD